MKRRPSAASQLRTLYDQIPEVGCKGLCGHECCGPVPVFKVEQKQMRRWHGRTLPLWPADSTTTCPLLSERGRCTVYADRPMLCRLWGAVDTPGMRCRHGCVPPAGFLTDATARQLLSQAEQIQPD